MAAPAPKRSSSLFQFALIFAIVYLGSQLILRTFFPQTQQQGPGSLTLTVPGITVGHHPILTLKNGTQTGVFLIDRCPNPPADIFFVEGSGSGEKLSSITSSQNAVPCVPPAASVAAHKQAQLPLSPWQFSVFSRTGIYEVRLPVYGQTGALAGVGLDRTLVSPTGEKIQPQQTLSARFTLSEPGAMTKLFRTFVTKPFLNLLIFIASIVPNHNLAVAIVILTLFVKFLLFFPTQHALEGQRKMQMLQPKLDELKKQFPNDAKRQQEETMKLWKEHKINPFQTCLPTLVQLPILIGLFYVIRDGSVLELSRHLIYPMYQDLPWRFGTNFFGLNLLQPEVIIFPVTLVILQFLQMKMAFSISDKKQAKKAAASGKPPAPASAMQTQQKVMLYMMPLMIGFFAIKFPAAVSLYWGISTLFGIGQQWYVNREHLRV
jgi:YidC/Oxa1 family membrane protein insertase